MKITLFRVVHDHNIDNYTVSTLDKTASLRDVVDYIVSHIPYQDYGTHEWYVPVKVTIVDGRGSRWRVWTARHGFDRVEHQTRLFLDVYNAASAKNPLLTQQYGDAVLCVTYGRIAHRPSGRGGGEDDSDSSIDRAICAVCKIGLPVPPQQCSACKTVLYCGADCQRVDWHQGGHKHACK